MNKLFLFFLFVFTGCATVSMPEGGMKDTEAPKILNTYPDSAQLNFHGQNITIEFDEFFTVSNFNTQVILSPPFEKPLKYSIKGKKLHIELPSPPLINTTYQLNLGESIADVNENNKLNNYNLVFSSGLSIDSSELKGKVISSILEEKGENLKAFLYREYRDSNPYNNPPYYVSQVQKDGSFHFQHISPSNYQIVVIDDKNGNMRYEKGEGIATIFNSIPSDSTNTTLQLFRESTAGPIKILGIQQLSIAEYRITLNQKINNYSLQTDIPFSNIKNQRLDHRLSETKDSIYFYVPPTVLNNNDSIQVTLTIDSITLKQSVAYHTKAKTNDIMLHLEDLVVSPKKDLMIHSNLPIQSTNSLHFTVFNLSDSQTVDHKVALSDPYTITISCQMLENKNYQIYLDSLSLSSLYSQRSTSDTLNIATLSSRNTGSFNFKVQLTNKDKYIIRLASKKNVVREWIVTSDSTIHCTYLSPGDYQLYYIHDENNDGMYSSGSLINRKQPENIGILQNKLEIKADWKISDLEYIIDN